MTFGAHMPTAGGLDRAIARGREIGCDAVQIFTKSPSQWHAAPLRDEAVAAYYNALRVTKIQPVVAHDAYLINLATGDRTVLKQSLEAFREEMQRAERLGVSHLVTHMGAHLGRGESLGLKRFAESLKALLDDTDNLKVQVALETTAGQGTSLGYRFEHIGEVISALDWHPRVAVCMDTCHIFAAGYELRTREGYDQTMRDLEQNVGAKRVAIIHANDSKKPLGSRVDRHAHIGQGEIGRAGFRNLLGDRRWAGVPMIIETPEAPTMHEVNLRTLRRLAKRSTGNG